MRKLDVLCLKERAVNIATSYLMLNADSTKNHHQNLY